MIYKDLICKSGLNKIKKPMLPYHWDLNIYRGCEHGCKYCFAMYSHSYLDEKEYFETIYCKKNIAEVLEKELSSDKWKGEVINIGGVTDSYQPIEKELGLMKEVLKLMIKYKNPIIISTKSDLILRDIDLIKELSNLTCVNIAFTITTIDDLKRSKLEPNGSPSLNRFKAIKRLKEETNAIVGVHVMPVIAYFNSSISNLDQIYRLSKKTNADYVLPGTLYLRGETRKKFLSFFKDYDYQQYQKFNKIYNDKIAKKNYKQQFIKLINNLEKKHELTRDYEYIIQEKIKELNNKNI